MNNRYFFQGVCYFLKGDRWFDSRGKLAAPEIQNRLYEVVLEDEGIKYASYKELSRDFTYALVHENSVLAIKIVQLIIDRAYYSKEYKEIRWILPRITSMFRRNNRPVEAIDFAKACIDEYGEIVASHALYTSLAAAYLDIGDRESCKVYIDKVGSCDDSAFIKNVMARLKGIENQYYFMSTR